MVLYVSAIANVMKTAMINWKRTTYFIRGRALTWKLGGTKEWGHAGLWYASQKKYIVFGNIGGPGQW